MFSSESYVIIYYYFLLHDFISQMFCVSYEINEFINSWKAAEVDNFPFSTIISFTFKYTVKWINSSCSLEKLHITAHYWKAYAANTVCSLRNSRQGNLNSGTTNEYSTSRLVDLCSIELHYCNINIIKINSS